MLQERGWVVGATTDCEQKDRLPAMRTLGIPAIVLLVLGISSSQARCDEARVFLIGNSLTQDTLPRLLGDGVQWHIDCGKNLKFIYENPKKPCVRSSLVWPAALAENRYEYLCVQPHFGTTINQDAAIIGHWFSLQPQAVLVLHTGWNRSQAFERDYHEGVRGEKDMRHNPAYFSELRQQLQQRFPGREIRSTHAIELLDRVYHDIQDGNAPFRTFQDLYRDDIHLQNQTGRYLMHNVMRIALGMPNSSRGFQLSPEHTQYFEAVLAEHASKYGPK